MKTSTKQSIRMGLMTTFLFAGLGMAGYAFASTGSQNSPEAAQTTPAPDAGKPMPPNPAPKPVPVPDAGTPAPTPPAPKK